MRSGWCSTPRYGYAHGFNCCACRWRWLFQGIPDSLADDIAEVIDDLNFGGGDLVDAMAQGDNDVLDAEVDDVDAVQAAIEADADGASGAGSHDAPPALGALVASASVSPLGYVNSAHPMFSDVPNVGRITSWPSSVPEMRRSMSCKCYLHPSCGSPAKGRKTVSDDLLLRWLFAGDYEQDVSRDRKRELGEAHRAKWKALFSAHVANAASTNSANGVAPSPAAV